MAFPFSTILQSECGWPAALIQILPGVQESACTLSPVRITFWCTARVRLGCRSNWTCFTAWNICLLPPPFCRERKVIKSLIRQGHSLLFFTSCPIIASCTFVGLSVAQICHESSRPQFHQPFLCPYFIIIIIFFFVDQVGKGEKKALLKK